MNLTLSQWFQRLSLVEFSNLELGQDGSGQIDWKDVRKIVALMNEGLLALYTRFVLSEKILLLEQIEGQTDYPLLALYADSQYVMGNPPSFIKDSAVEPYREDLLKVLKVVGEDSRVLPLNEDKNPASLHLPQFNVLRIPDPVDGQLLTVSYQARHPELKVSDSLMLTDLNQEIELPSVLHIAFRAYMSYRLYGAMNTETSIQRSQEHYQMYEGECARAFQEDTVNSSKINTPDKFTVRGWV